MNKLLEYESRLWSKGLSHIAGVDEAGRGPLAGPLVIASVILNKNHFRNNDVTQNEYSIINDSKLLSNKKRRKLLKFIIRESICYSIVEIDDKRLDKRGVKKATITGFEKSIKSLSVLPEHVITDFFEIPNLNKNRQTNLKAGDRSSISVAAASILAKVHRDNIMIEFHKKYPNYGFDRHKGYGTEAHRKAICKHGPCDIHRKSFEPIKSLFKEGVQTNGTTTTD